MQGWPCAQPSPEPTWADSWGLAGLQQQRRREGAYLGARSWLCCFNKHFVAVQVQHGHNQQHWRLSYGQIKKKKKANSVPLNPRRTESILSLCQPPQGSSCSPPGSPAGPLSLRWELQRGCWRKGSLYPLLEMLYLPF